MVRSAWRRTGAMALVGGVLLLCLLLAQTAVTAIDATSGDTNQDGAVTTADLDFIIGHWDTTNPAADIDNSGRVDILDLSLFLQQHGSVVQAGGQPASPSAAAKGYGIAAGSSLLALSPTDLNKRLDGIAATGAEWIRVDFSWPSIQPSNPRDYQWDLYDRIVSAATARKLKILAILDYTPQWARPSDCFWAIQCRPADPNQFATFAAATAARYSSQGVRTWEIWNEQNIGFWQPRADPAQYTALLKATSAAIRQQDPQSYILTGGFGLAYTGGTTYSPLDFLRGIYANGGKDSFDGVAMHPYTFPYQPTSSLPNPWKEMYTANPSLHSIMADNGDAAKKIWITEFGAPTGGPGPVATLANPQYNLNPYVVDESLQQAILADAIQQYATADWAGPFFYYSYIDSGTSPTTNENFFGLVRYDGSFKPAYTTFKAAAQAR